MRTNEFYETAPDFVPEFEQPYTEFASGTEFGKPICEEALSTEAKLPVNEFSEAVPEDDAEGENRFRKFWKTVKKRKNLLLQAAAVLTGIVLITSSVGVDVLGDELSGGMLDEVLKNAGAKKGVITVSMLWETTDDVDLHIITPDGHEIFYANPYAAGGELDVDMQAGIFVEHPVENIYFESPPERGEYLVFIEMFADRNPGDPKVLVQVTVRGRTKAYTVTLDQFRKEICRFNY